MKITQVDTSEMKINVWYIILYNNTSNCNHKGLSIPSSGALYMRSYDFVIC